MTTVTLLRTTSVNPADGGWQPPPLTADLKGSSDPPGARSRPGGVAEMSIQNEEVQMSEDTPKTEGSAGIPEPRSNGIEERPSKGVGGTSGNGIRKTSSNGVGQSAGNGSGALPVNGVDARSTNGGTLPWSRPIQERPPSRITITRDGTPEVGMNGHRETMEAVSRLAGKVTHHLSNLLTVVEGNVSILQAELTDRRFSSELRDIRKACERASELSGRLLSISGCRWYEPRTVDLRALVSDMDLGRYFAAGVGFCTDFSAAPCTVRVDPAHLGDLLLELVLNASEALENQGNVRVAIDVLPWKRVRHNSPLGCVQLDVSDSGKGMDMETLERVFHPFFGAHPFSENRGLGLSVVYGIVRQTGGTMTVSSAPGRGTTVRVWFPFAGPVPEQDERS
ncbi:MAG: hypothetical protein EA352_07465 [Gemmatimonadales bacterium]|nr:MAG: hypothetical protein EA352_07465 [Gemmatimonadales bacterium]